VAVAESERLKVESPPVRLRELLAEARERGDPWRQAWESSLSVAMSALSSREGRNWTEVIEWSAPYYRAAYGRAPFEGCTAPLYRVLDA
jgi:hypothetical protein